MKLEQRILIGAQSTWQRLLSKGMIEHAAHEHAVDVFASDAKTNDSTTKYVDHYEDPMASKQNRLAAKQVHAPEAVLGVREESQPRGAREAGIAGIEILGKGGYINRPASFIRWPDGTGPAFY